MNPARDSTQPEQFGPYEVYERLGMGGMASVHRAKKRGPESFERTVALKRMLSHLTEDRGFVDSFVREAKVASMLVHPNVAQVYDFGRIGGIFYIAMELVAGFDLRKMLRYANRSGEPIPLQVVLSILGEICDALDYAHSFVDESGQPLHIVHRDVSPSNIIVAHTGHAKVIDFGIAKANSRQLHTESGLVKGKLGYMAPEAAMGMQIGPASDVFSMGVVAWELVTALPLFSSRTDFETMRRLREERVPPPSQHNASCPPQLDALILAALARDVEHRVTSARAFRTGLDSIAAQYNIQVSARAVADWMKRLTAADATVRASMLTGPHRPKSPSGRVLPLPPPEVTSVSRPRSSTQAPPLRRTDEDVALATEIWGEDGTHHPDSGPAGPDFSLANDVIDTGIAGKLSNAHVYTPAHYNTGVPSLAGRQSSQPNYGTPSQPNYGTPSQPHYGTPSSPQFPQYGTPSQPAFGPHVTPSGTHPQFGSQSSGGYAMPASGGHPSMPHLSSQSMPLAAPKKSSKTTLAVVALLLVVGSALGAILYLKRDKPAAPAAATDAHLAFAIEPAGSIVEVGGNPVGLETTLAPGVYSLAVRHDGYKTWTGSVTLREGDRQTINVALEKSPTVVAAVTPPDAATQTETSDEPDDSEPTSKRTTKDRKHSNKNHHVSESPSVDAPHVETKVEPPKDTTEPPKDTRVEPPKDTKVEPPKDTKVNAPKDTKVATNTPKLEPVVDTKPARTPVVAASAVSKLSGEVPVLRGSSGSGDVLAKMCIDEAGKVTSVKIMKSPPEISGDLQRALMGWRYAPYKNKDQKVTAVCFPLALRVVLKN
ncbi:MAG: protein kinase [Kofleriaceae bacterium]|nr:protein kinase [Kofleriaceae bacterium]